MSYTETKFSAQSQRQSTQQTLLTQTTLTMELFGIKKEATLDLQDPVPSTSASKEGPDATIEAEMVKVEHADVATPYVEHKDQFEEEFAEESKTTPTIKDRIAAVWALVIAFWLGLSKTVQVAIAAGAAVAAVAAIALMVFGPTMASNYNVAFVGNAYFYVNDLPRAVEGLANGHIYQDSVIHNDVGVLELVMTGNGMWEKWATKNAMLGGKVFVNSDNETSYLYDMGSCTVTQLLTGVDKMLTYQNEAGTYADDGSNPCFEMEDYREYHQTAGRVDWDYVVIADQSERMATKNGRSDALTAFDYTYYSILEKYDISPIIVQPHAYFDANNGVDDLTAFTALIMEGAETYKEYLNQRLGSSKSTVIAPVGNAFLAVYEEYPTDLWKNMFMDDGVHPSAYGTYLYALIIYATITGKMPKYDEVVVEDVEDSDIFAFARRLQASGSQSGFPSETECAELYKIAKKVVKGYTPQTLRGFETSSVDTSSYFQSIYGNQNQQGGNNNNNQNQYEYYQNQYRYNKDGNDDANAYSQRDYEEDDDGYDNDDANAYAQSYQDNGE